MRNGTDTISRNRPGVAGVLSVCSLLAVFLVALLPAGGCRCTEENSAQGGEELVIRSYTVAPEYGDELREILKSMFYPGGDADPVGSVRLFREGLVVVAAPASMHAGIEEVIASLDRTVPTPPPTIRISFWAIEGKKADITAWPPRLDQLREALEAVSSTDGPLDFSLQEKIVLNSLSGSRASTDGPYFGVQQVATARDGTIHADLRIDKGPVMQLRTSVRLEPGQLMVLEQAGFTDRVQGAPELAQTSTYIILQAEVVSADGR